jgi:streptogramin lyase
VPTDVEMGPDGYLYVSGLGAEVIGHIYKVNARTGAIVETWGDLPPLTGIDVARDGTIYVASLFTNQVFRISRTGVEVAEIPAPADVELGHGMVLVSSLTGSIFKVHRNAFS